MPTSPSERIRLCRERAAEAAALARDIGDPEARADFLAMERRWLALARSYEFGESPGDSLRELDPFEAAAPIPSPSAENEATPAEDQKPVIRKGHADHRFEALLLASASVVWWTNAAGEFIEEQPYWQAYTGQSWDEYRGSRWISIIHPEDREAVVRDWNRAVASGNVYFTQGRVWCAKYSGYRAFQTRGVAIRNKRGEVEEWLGALTDVQDTLDLQHAKQDRIRYAQMLDLSFDAVVLRDANDRIAFWNQGATALYGWTADEALGRTPRTLLRTEFPKPLEEIMADLRREGRWAGELTRRSKDGRDVTVLSRWTLEQDGDGQPAYVLESNLDVTERRQAETRVAAELRDMKLLNDLSVQLVRADVAVSENLEGILQTAMGIARADKGNIQLFDEASGSLKIAAQQGFERAFLKFFEHVRDDASACSASMRAAERVVIEDVTTSQIFAGQPSKEVLLGAHVRAVISTPLKDSNGKLLGMVSTHFCEPHRPAERELRLLDLLARQAADYLERKRAEETAEILIREVQHRSNNLLSVIQAIATQSISENRTIKESKEAFEARLHALGRANRALTQANWSGARVRDIVDLEMQPYAGRTTVEGVDITLNPQLAQNLTLVIHELATNAAKHGALSNGSGKVAVSWTFGSGRDDGILVFKWRETGGPPVEAPVRRGFGARLITTVFPDAQFEYLAEGLACTFDIPIGAALGPGR
jgi:PAS domain S-box-containing protein